MEPRRSNNNISLILLHICPVLPAAAVAVHAEVKDLTAASHHWPEREEEVETGFKVLTSHVIELDVNMMVTDEQPTFCHGTNNSSNMKSNKCVIKG